MGMLIVWETVRPDHGCVIRQDRFYIRLGHHEQDAAGWGKKVDRISCRQAEFVTDVYTPALAIIRHAGIVKAIKRPKWTGGRRLDWLRPDDAFKLLERPAFRSTRILRS
jgi:hypothetical protein